MDQRAPLSPPRPQSKGDQTAARAAHRVPHRGAMRLVAQPVLALDLSASPAPAEWHAALEALAARQRITLAPTPAPAPRNGSAALRQIARRAAAGVAGTVPPPCAPLFAPWQVLTPSALQSPQARAALPQAGWLAGYVLDPAGPRSRATGWLDILLASPHPSACLDEAAGEVALPRKAVLDAMLAEVCSQQRERLAIIVPARARSAMAQRLLAASRALIRGDLAIEIIAIEEAIARLIRADDSWDAMIVLPELRGVIAAVLAEISGIEGPWPLAWCDSARGLIRVTAEALREAPAGLPLDAAMLMQGLALAAHHGGLSDAAQHLAAQWMRLRDSGAATATRRALSPYGTELSDAGFLALACEAPGSAGGRQLPGWQALGGPPVLAKGNQRRHSPVSLSLVRS